VGDSTGSLPGLITILFIIYCIRLEKAGKIKKKGIPT